VATLSLKVLWDLLANLDLSPTQNVYTFNKEGQLIAHSDQVKVYTSPSIPPELVKTFFKSRSPATYEYLSANRQAMLAGFSLIKKLQFGIVIETPKSEALNPALAGMTESLFVAFLIAIISIMAGRTLARIIVQPVTNLSDAVEDVTNTHTASKVNVTGTIEIQKLSHTFNKMTTRLEATIFELKSQIESREKSETALRESDQRFQTIADNLTEVFWLGSLEDPNNYKVLYVNPAFEKTWQLTREAIYQNPTVWQNSIHPDDRERVRNSFISFCKGEKPYKETYRMTPKDGVEKIIRVTGNLIRNEQGKIIQVAGISRDITEFRKTEQALRRSQKMDAIGQLTGGIAHDFNNILGIILGNLDLLDYQITANDKIHNRIQTIRKSAVRAADLTRQLLGFSRRQAEQLTDADINKVIHSMGDLITRSVTPKITIDYMLVEDLWLTTIDTGDFQDALLNLILNARDAMPGGGQLMIETNNCVLDSIYCESNPDVTAGEYVQLSISDNGIGIPHDQQEHIFEPFFTTKPQGKGTGLGLSMVFGFIKRTLGHIRVYSELEVGTIFHLYLPRCEQSKVQITEPTPALPEVLPRGKETILIVDDEEGLLDFAEESLESLGYHVITASSGKQALEQLEKTTSVNLLFSDVVMPGGINGYELCELATKIIPDLKVLLTSGYTDNNIIHNGHTKYGAHLLSKPYTQADLARRIRKRLGETKVPIALPVPNKSADLSAEPETRIIEWSEEYSIAVEAIDEDHRILIDLMNRSQQVIDKDQKALPGILIELIEYTKTHFRREEAIMEVCRYPGFANHQQVHRLLSLQMEEKMHRASQGALSPQELQTFLNGWITDHIKGMDQALTAYCVGKTELIADALEKVKERPL